MNWIEKQIKEILNLNEQIISNFDEIEIDILNRKPGTDTWSINQCFDHTIQTNKKYYHTLDEIRTGTYKGGKLTYLPILPSLFGKLLVNTVSPNNKRKSKTFLVFLPLYSEYEKNIAIELIAENKVLTEKLSKLNEDLLDRIIVSSPANRFVTYSLRDCITILVVHEKRHYNQAVKLKSLFENSV